MNLRNSKYYDQEPHKRKINPNIYSLSDPCYPEPMESRGYVLHISISLRHSTTSSLRRLEEHNLLYVKLGMDLKGKHKKQHNMSLLECLLD